MTKQESKQAIQKLVEKYQRILREGKVQAYNEAQTRNEFIEPMFQYLGWDMRNAEVEGEVTTEEGISGGRVDLSFRLSGVPAFFLEAKSMKVDLDEWKWAEQAINYAWNKSATWAVLTDFESIKIFNAEIPPKNLSRNLFIEISVNEYVERFDQLWLLSKESFEKRLLDKEAEKWGKITKRRQVGEKLFEDLMSWRTMLSANFKKLNKLSDDEVDEGVQRILDRLIFIRTAEDRKIEQIILQALLREWETKGNKHNIYKRLVDGFRWFDENYNSKLFALHYCEEWQADDAVLADILKGLYESNDGYRYDFSAISADVLGGIYEQYLSFVQSRKGEEKAKSKRKTQGIFYTPKYIVEFIVKETLGKMLMNTKPKDIQRIKVLDPACGSGSFLTVAYDVILESIGNHSLFTKFEILKDNIYGIDLDAQAIEIAQLNLLLKVLSQRTKLPALQHNLRVGNSLLSEGDMELRPFNVASEFKEVMDQGGFDIIVGNPPYIKEYTNRLAFDGLHESPYYQGKMDIWTLFACNSIDLLKNGGYLCFIAPSNWLTNAGASIFRDKILSEGQIVKFLDFGDFKVFKDAGIQTMIFIFQKGKPRKTYKVSYAKVSDKSLSAESIQALLSNSNAAIEGITRYDLSFSPKAFLGKSIVFASETNDAVLNAIEEKKNFELHASEVAQGIVAAPDKCFLVSDVTLFNEEELAFIKPYFTAAPKFAPSSPDKHIIYLCDRNFGDKNIDNFPGLKNHFEFNKKVLTEAKKKYKTPDKPYYYLHREREERFFKEGPKVVGQIRTAFPSFLYTERSYYGSRAMNFIQTDRISLKYLTGLLNSRLVYFWLKNKGKQLGDLLQIDKGPLLSIPICKPSSADQESVAVLVDQVTKYYDELRNTPENTEKWSALNTQINKAERKIDDAIYKIYDLSSDSIGTVESLN